jgi:hypothetical protein
MDAKTKTYVTTDRAGFTVAGRRVPADYEGAVARPCVGFEMELLDAEAEYELAQGTIALKGETGNGAAAPAAKAGKKTS